MEAQRIFMPEQIVVHPDLPGILKEFTKACIKANPGNSKDIATFGMEYFASKMEAAKAAVAAAAVPQPADPATAG